MEILIIGSITGRDLVKSVDDPWLSVKIYTSLYCGFKGCLGNGYPITFDLERSLWLLPPPLHLLPLPSEPSQQAASSLYYLDMRHI